MPYTIEQIKELVNRHRAFSPANPKADAEAARKNADFFELLNKLPEEVIKKVIETHVFIVVEEKTAGMTFSLGHPLFEGRKGFVLFCPHLWKEDGYFLVLNFAHEIAHAYFEHNPPRGCTEEEKKAVEIEADKTAVDWLSGEYERRDLIRKCRYYKGP
jgi:hypothetical protein